MHSTDTYPLIGTEWGKAASGTYLRIPPVASQIGIIDGAASWTDGFPPLTFLDRLTAGGKAPSGKDMNGVFNELSRAIQATQAGRLPHYDSGFCTAIGGYPLGAVLQGTASLASRWRNTVEGNTSNPDTGGSGWVDESLFSLNVAAVNNITGLRALSKILYSKCIVYGYYAAGDQGGSDYYYDATDTTTADNGGSVIVASDGGRWKMVDKRVVGPRQFGCVMDGTTDDLVPCQKLLNEASIWNIDCRGEVMALSAQVTKTVPDGSIFYFSNLIVKSLGIGNIQQGFINIQGPGILSSCTVAAVAHGATTLTVTSGTVIAGQTLLLMSDDLWNDVGVNTFPSVTMGEFVVAKSVSGATVTLQAPVRYDYSTNVVAKPMGMAKLVEVSNVTGISDNTSYAHSPIQVFYATSVVAREVVGINCSYAGFYHGYCQYITTYDCSNYDPDASLGLGYGVISAYATTAVTHYRPHGRGCRHITAHGGYSGVIQSTTVIDAYGENQQEGVIDAHAAVDQQYVIFSKGPSSSSANSKNISSQARRLYLEGVHVSGVANAIVWNPACTAYPSSLVCKGANVSATSNTVIVGIASTQPCEWIDIDGKFKGGQGGVNGDGIQVSYSSNLNVTGATPGQIQTFFFRGKTYGQQRGIYFISGTRGQTFGNVTCEGEFETPAIAGSFPVYVNCNNNSDMAKFTLRGKVTGGAYGVELFHTTNADVRIDASGWISTNDAVINYQATDTDAYNRYDIWVTGPSTVGVDQHRGVCTANGTATVTVNNSCARSGSIVKFFPKTVGGSFGSPRPTNFTSKTSFQFISVAGDTSTYWYELSNPLTGP